jgi:hypothetical protein
MRTLFFTAALALSPQVTIAQSAPVTVTVPAGAPVALATLADLNSKKALKGDQVELIVTEDLFVDGVLAIPKGVSAKGRINLAQDTGAFGQSGKLQIEPLYVQIGSEILRLKGNLDKKGTISVGGAVGLALITPGFTGRSVKLPSGTVIPATVLFEKAISVTAPN